MKTPVTRLLDLLAGWTEYVSTDEEHGLHDPHLTADAIGALYQEAGQLMDVDDWPEKFLKADREIRRFVEDKILPALLAR